MKKAEGILWGSVVVGTLLLVWFSWWHAGEEEAVCKQNMRLILRACMLYAADHGGYLPVGGSDEKRRQLSPYLKSMGRARRDVWTSGHGKVVFPDGCAYEFCEGVVKMESGRGGRSATPYMWDRKGNHEGGRNVGFSDGRVEWMREEEFEELVKGKSRRSECEDAPATVEGGR